MTTRFFSLFLLAFILFEASVPSVVHAQSPGPCGFYGFFERPLPGLPPCIDQLIDPPGATPLTTYVSILVNFLTALIVAIGVLMVIAGGYFYMTAGGSADRVQLGKSIIIAALTGIVLALTAWVLLNTLGGAQFSQPSEPEIIIPCTPGEPNVCIPRITCPANGICPRR